MEVVLWGETERDWEICHDYEEALRFVIEQYELGVSIFPVKICSAEMMTNMASIPPK